MMTELTRNYCVDLDKSDPLAGFREKFHLRDNLIYMDGNSLGALPKATVARMNDAVQNQWGDGLITSWLQADWVNAPRRIGDKIARLLGAEPGEVIAADSTSINIFKALTAALQINRGRSVILSEVSNFPTDVYMMQGIEAFTEGRVKSKLVMPEAVLDSLDETVAALLLTQVHYKSGLIRDMAAVTAKAHAYGIPVIWDLSHSAGSIEVDLNGANADFAVGCGYKFLNGGPGAPAFLFVAKRHQAVALPVLSGWFGHQSPFDFKDEYHPAPGISRYLCGTPPILGLTALECGVDLFATADMALVRQKAMRLGDLFIRLMEDACADYGFQLASPRDAAQRGSQVSFVHEHGYAIMQELKVRGVIGDFRAPNVLRFGLTPLYLRYQDVYDAVSIIRDIMETSAWDKPEYQVRAPVT
jgi:kynureninase